MAKKANISASVGIDGEKEFRQAITNINSDMKVLTSEMKKVTSEFSDNSKSVDALTAKDKVLNEQIEKQKDKVEALRKAMENSKDQYPDNVKKLNDYKSSLNAAEAKLFDLTHEVDTNKKALEQAKNPTVQLANEVTDLGQAADTAGKHSLKMGDIIKANLISSAIINGVKQLASAIKDIAMQSITAADEIATLAGQTGFSAEEIQVWQYVGKGLDIEVETITGSISKLTRAMTAAKNGTKAQADAFKALGVNVTNSDGSFRDSKVVMMEAFEALNKVGNETERDSIALVLFGKSALELNPLIKAGSKEIDKLTKAAYENGGVMSDATVEGLDKFKDSTEMLNQEIQAMTGELMVELMPAFNELIQWFRDNKEEIKKFAEEALKAVSDGFQWIIDNKDAIILGLELILGAFAALKILGAINILLGVFNTLLYANPLVMGALAVGGLLWIIYKMVDGFKDLDNNIRRSIQSMKDLLGIKGNKVNINMDNPSAGNTFGGGGGRAWATGAIFTRPTLMPNGDLVGEKSMEGVLPIKQLPSLLGMDNLADNIANAIDRKMKNMVVMMDGEQFGSFVDVRFTKAMAR